MREWIRVRFGVLVSSSAIAIAALVLAGSSVTAGGGVTGAVFTTTNPATDNGSSGSPVLCNNGNPGVSGPNYVPAINCNIYTSKSYVWMTGGPGPSGLADGTYFFSVLVPGGQPDPNDGGANNLSDTTADPWAAGSLNADFSAIPTGDAYTNRTFSVSGGVISYSGSHTFSHNEIRLMPYDDTTNQGGVYIMAICALPAPAEPSKCKYDAFKVLAPEVPIPPAVGLTVTKDAAGSYTNTFTWGISKSVDRTLVKQSGTSATFNYTVSVTHDNGTIGNVEVAGTIQVFNPNTDGVGNQLSVTGVTVSDKLSDGTTCAVVSGTDQTLSLFETDFSYSCNLNALPQGSLDNTATVSWPDQTLSDQAPLAAGSADFMFANVAFAETKIDDSVTVTDPLGGGLLGTVHSTDSSPTVFTYSNTVTGTPGTCKTVDNTATFTSVTSPMTGSSNTVTVHLCVGADLTVDKTATPFFTRTFAWGISKAVDQTLVKQSTTSATFNYTVTVTHDAGADSAWKVSGTITVTNPNDWEDITADVTDSINNGGSCVVSGGSSVLVPKSGSVSRDYVCTYASAPSPAAFSNTGTATWNAVTASTVDSSDARIVTGAFGDPTKLVDDSVTVTDPLGGGLLGTVHSTDLSPTIFTYSNTVTGTSGTCTTVDNTATFKTDTTLTTGSANKSVQLCVGADLTVTKTTTPGFTRTYAWNITKGVDKTLVKQVGGSATFNYTVVATELGFADSAWQVTGTITVSNPNSWEAISATITDSIDNGGTCTITGGTSFSVPANGSASRTYTCIFGTNPVSGTNTATASWDSGAAFTPDASASGTADYVIGAVPTITVKKTITVTDTFNGGTPMTLGTVTATDSTPFASRTFTYARVIAIPQFGCKTYPNTAKIVETGLTASASVKVCGPIQTGALTIGFWQNKNGQAIINGGASTAGVCNSGTWLRQFAPFQDLSATATCAQVAAYFTGVFNVANAGGTTMNPMLKAQMLATALDVYFSNPALGGNKIGAPAPIGGVTIDLTNIGGSENVSAAFGGATSMTVLQMITYAAGQSNAGGSTWYANIKATQGLAKDAFDAINNQLVFGP